MGYTTDFDGQFEFSRPLTIKELNKFEEIVGEDTDIGNKPDSYCHWEVVEDGTQLRWDYGEKFYYYAEWLKWLIDNFFEPKNIKLNGIVLWDGEDRTDIGKITIMDNDVNITKGKIVYEEQK